MLRLRNLGDLNRKRTIKPIYTHTQAYPHAATLDANFNRAAGQLTGDPASDGSKAAINPGAVMTKLADDVVTLSGATAGSKAFGLAAQFVGGDMDELHGDSTIGVWRGGGTFLLRAPAFNATGLADAALAEDGTAGKEVYLLSDTDGRLVQDDNAVESSTTKRAVARLITMHSDKAIEIELLV